MTTSTVNCPVCGGSDVEKILEIADLPVFCNIQLDTREQALSQPRGDMRLEYCTGCSHIFNSAFDESLLAYSQTYENSLHFSGTFSSFAEDLARLLVAKHRLQGKTIVDIGCGKGDFLALICSLGDNEGHGFDLSYEEGRSDSPAAGRVRFYREYFTADHARLRPDLITCRHVLEHIPEPNAFLSTIAAAMRESATGAVYLEVPNALFTVRDLGIWDLIYEHCHYFTAESLRRVCSEAGMGVDEVDEVFGGQFLALNASTSHADSGDAGGGKRAEAVTSISGLVGEFGNRFAALRDKWQSELEAVDGSVVVWGGGSKGVSFLNMLPTANRVAGIVDINPHKHNKFVPVSGHEILAPEALTEVKPDRVLIMNPLYRGEIERQIGELGIRPEIMVVQ